MRRFEHEGRKHKLTEKQYQQLLDRLDTSRAVLRGTVYRIRARCICPQPTIAGYNCRHCPLGGNSGHARCMVLLEAAGEMEVPFSMSFLPTGITWNVSSKEPKELLDRARQKLLELPKTR